MAGTVYTMHPSSAGWIESTFEDWEAARDDAFSQQQEQRWERETLAQTREWRDEIEAEIGNELSDSDWLEFVADELVGAAEAQIDAAMENGTWGLAHLG